MLWKGKCVHRLSPEHEQRGCPFPPTSPKSAFLGRAIDAPKTLKILLNKKIMVDDRKQTISNAIGFYLDSVFKFLNGETEDILYPLPVVYDL